MLRRFFFGAAASLVAVLNQSRAAQAPASPPHVRGLLITFHWHLPKYSDEHCVHHLRIEGDAKHAIKYLRDYTDSMHPGWKENSHLLELVGKAEAIISEYGGLSLHSSGMRFWCGYTYAINQAIRDQTDITFKHSVHTEELKTLGISQ